MKILFLDESGYHNLSIIDPQYPVFVLGGIIVDEDCYYNIIGSEIKQFKERASLVVAISFYILQI